MNLYLIEYLPSSFYKLPDIREILLIGFYQQSREMAQFISNMYREYNIPIRSVHVIQGVWPVKSRDLGGVVNKVL